MSGQRRLDFADLDGEMALARDITAAQVEGAKDLFEGITNWAERKARARIAIIIGRLDASFEQRFERVYGEPIKAAKAAKEQAA